MKKLILPLVAVLFLLPQYSNSQSFVSTDNNVLSLVSEIKNSVSNIHLFGTIKTLTSFELVNNEEDDGLKVTASFEKSEKFDVEIYNAEGMVIFEEAFETDELNLVMGFANLPVGEYFVSIATKDGKTVKPLK